MRIALNSTLVNQINKQNGQKALPELKVGDVIMAEIVSLDGENVTLKSRDGAVFIAKMLANINILLGDTVELMVSSKEGDKYIMQNLSLESGVIENISHQQSTYANEGKAHSAIISTLKNLGVMQSPQLVDSIINIMSEHPDVNVKSAVFMAINDIPASKENIDVLKQLTGNENIGNELFEIMEQVVIKEGATQNVPSTNMENNTIVANTNNFQTVNAPDSNVVATNEPTILDVAANVISDENIVLNTTLEGITSETNPQDSQVNNNAQDNVTNEVKTASTPLENNNTLVYNSVDTEMGELKPQYTTKHVVEKILSMFVSLEDIKEDDAKLKEANKDLNQKLSDLKKIVKNSDIRNREDVTLKTDKIISKNKMASDISRFTYMQIPVNYSEERKTAELFVYRRKKNTKKLDPNDIVMLIGLDTTNLGRVETAIKVQNKNVSLKICQETGSAIEILKKRSIGLKKVLGDIGFLLSDVKVERLFEKTTVVNAEEVLLRADTKSSTIVDYKI